MKDERRGKKTETETLEEETTPDSVSTQYITNTLISLELTPRLSDLLYHLIKILAFAYERIK